MLNQPVVLKIMWWEFQVNELDTDLSNLATSAHYWRSVVIDVFTLEAGGYNFHTSLATFFSHLKQMVFCKFVYGSHNMNSIQAMLTKIPQVLQVLVLQPANDSLEEPQSIKCLPCPVRQGKVIKLDTLMIFWYLLTQEGYENEVIQKLGEVTRHFAPRILSFELICDKVVNHGSMYSGLYTALSDVMDGYKRGERHALTSRGPFSYKSMYDEAKQGPCVGILTLRLEWAISYTTIPHEARDE